jgi:small subunit ribosomal protein S9
VRLVLGEGAIIVNGSDFDQRFPRLEHQRTILEPLQVTNTLNKFNAIIKVAGGGVSGQAQAISHGVARALLKADETFRPLLRSEDLLTRDPRVKERKKYGLKRARKAPQYTKR